LSTRRPRRPPTGGGIRGVGVFGGVTARGSTPRVLGRPLRCSQRQQAAWAVPGAAEWRDRVGGRQVRQHPAPASTPGTDEDVQRERPARHLRPVHSRCPLLLWLLADRCLGCHALSLLSCLRECGGPSGPRSPAGSRACCSDVRSCAGVSDGAQAPLVFKPRQRRRVCLGLVLRGRSPAVPTRTADRSPESRTAVGDGRGSPPTPGSTARARR